MSNVKSIPKYILDDVRQQAPFGRENWSDVEINAMTANEIFNRWLVWQGFIGWTETILGAVDGIYKTEIRK